MRYFVACGVIVDIAPFIDSIEGQAVVAEVAGRDIDCAGDIGAVELELVVTLYIAAEIFAGAAGDDAYRPEAGVFAQHRCLGALDDLYPLYVEQRRLEFPDAPGPDAIDKQSN